MKQLLNSKNWLVYWWPIGDWAWGFSRAYDWFQGRWMIELNVGPLGVLYRR